MDPFRPVLCSETEAARFGILSCLPTLAGCGSEEAAGDAAVCWDDVEQSGSLGTPVDRWLVCGDREVHVRLQLVTSPIDGADEDPLFDPRQDMHRMYAEVSETRWPTSQISLWFCKFSQCIYISNTLMAGVLDFDR